MFDKFVKVAKNTLTVILLVLLLVMFFGAVM